MHQNPQKVEKINERCNVQTEATIEPQEKRWRKAEVQHVTEHIPVPGYTHMSFVTRCSFSILLSVGRLQNTLHVAKCCIKVIRRI